MKTVLKTLVLLLVAASSLPFQGRAQAFDQRPETPFTGKRYSEIKEQKKVSGNYVNPFIVSMVNQVSADSIAAIIQHLQDYGTRFPLNSNRKEVANWLAQKFISYGYSPGQVMLDSFQINYQGTQYWQYNVVCTLTGSSAPLEEYHIGGHYDSYCNGNPMIQAPGADDNASATAATMEVARVMKKMNYQPEATLRFYLWAAEELGLYGSMFNATRARLNQTDVRYYLNLDMVSNNPSDKKEVLVYKYLGMEWAGNLAADIFERYTDLSVLFPSDLQASGSDSYSYWRNDYPTAYLEEIDFSPNWHRLSDTIGNCNIPYLANVTKGALAVMAEQQFLPVPIDLRARSSKNNITLNWKPTSNASVAGYNVYRSDNPGFTGPVKINTSLVSDSFYVDATIPSGIQFFYRINIVNDSAVESMPSQIVSGARFAFCDTLLVVAAMKGSTVTDDSIRGFYTAILDTVPFRWFDYNSIHPLDLNTMSRYQNILFLINSFDFDRPDPKLFSDLKIFFENGGNMLFSGFTPSYFMERNTAYPKRLLPESFMGTYFKADSVNRKFNSVMNKANASLPGYDTLRTDAHKVLDPAFPGEIFNIEVYTNRPGANVIYRFNSQYPPTSGMGLMQDKPVGLEYIGSDYRTILLSFPLYYMDTADAGKLMKYVLKYKFTHPSTGIASDWADASAESLRVFPNPFSAATTLEFRLNRASDVSLTVYNLQGNAVVKIAVGRKDAGTHKVTFNAASLQPGVYTAVLRTGSSAVSAKMVLLR